MKKNNKKVSINFNILYSKLRGKSVTASAVSERLGYEKSYLSSCKKEGEIEEVTLRLICDLYNINIDELVLKEQKTTNLCDSSKTTSTSIEIIKKLDAIINLLEVKERANMALTAQEDVVILLRQMLKYGSCEESQFKSKAKSFGYDSDLCNFAADFLDCKREVVNGKVWLKKGK